MTTPLQYMGALDSLGMDTKFAIVERMRTGGVLDANLAQVGILWDAYLDATAEKKLPPFIQGQAWQATFTEMERTGLPKMTISGFLTALRAYSYDTGKMEYIDPAGAGAARRAAASDLASTLKDAVKTVISAPAKAVQVATDPLLETGKKAAGVVTEPLKWLAILAASGAVIWVGWQVYTATKPLRKRRR